MMNIFVKKVFGLQLNLILLKFSPSLAYLAV